MRDETRFNPASPEVPQVRRARYTEDGVRSYKQEITEEDVG